MFAPGVIFAPHAAAAPDVAWFEGRASLDRATGPDQKWRGVELLIEVLSAGRANQRSDRVLKLRQYSRFGVREYWIASWRTETVEICRLGATGLELVETRGATDTRTSPHLPGFAVSVRELFPLTE